MTPFNQIAYKIIKEQELIIGPVAWSEAKKVEGIRIIDQKTGEMQLAGGPKQVIDRLVAQYERLFGRASHEVSREAASALIASLSVDEIPLSLK